MNISIGELSSCKEIFIQISQCFNTFDKSFSDQKDNIQAKLYCAYKLVKNAYDIFNYPATKHNYALDKKRNSVANFYLVDDSLINTHGTIVDITTKDYTNHKLVLLNLIKIEDAILNLISRSTVQNRFYFEYLSFARVNCMEARFLIEYSLETKYKEKIDIIKD
jgi:hypothetical protein